MMTRNAATFADAQGREWTVMIQWGHPVPAERGIVAVRFECLDDAAEPARLGYAMQAAIESLDEEELREALYDSEPAREIG
jgi:hypothetical protein